MAIINQNQWDEFLGRFPDAHILQTSRWGEFKKAFGWLPLYVQNQDSGAQILFRQLPLGLTVAYIPKGPIGMDWGALLPDIENICRRRRAIVIYIEPDTWQDDSPILTQKLPRYKPSSISIQPRRTITLSLEGGEEEWLQRMKQKTRYNIRLAEKKGVIIAKSTDLVAFNELMQVTGERDQFGVHQESYYRAAYELFHPDGLCELFMAVYENRPLAAIMVFKRGRRAWYFYGASDENERNRMPTYLLQWEAMRWAAEAGCMEYDLWGVPDQDEDTLEAKFADHSDGLWGVYRFKRGFGGQLKRTAGVYERILQPGIFQLYSFAIRMRKKGMAG